MWLKDLQPFNEHGNKATIADISNQEFRLPHYDLVQGDVFLDRECLVAPELEDLLGIEENSCLRETSLLEAYFCNGKGLQMRWASQEVVHIDVKNEEDVSIF